MTEQGAAADTAGREWSARRRRALRKGPRAPGPPPPSKHWVPEAWRAGWPLAKAGLTEPRTLRGASRRSIPLLWEREGKRERRWPRACFEGADESRLYDARERGLFEN